MIKVIGYIAACFVLPTLGLGLVMTITYALIGFYQLVLGTNYELISVSEAAQACLKTGLAFGPVMVLLGLMGLGDHDGYD